MCPNPQGSEFIKPVQPEKHEPGEPRNENERRLATIWRQILEIDRVGIRDNFFDLGGDSSAAAEMIACIAKEFGKKLQMASLFEVPTIEGVALLLGSAKSGRLRIATFHPVGTRTPLFFVHGHPLFRELAREITTDRPFVMLVPPSTGELNFPFTVEDIAKYHVQSIHEIQPRGPYFLGGWCNDGVVAYEVARQLRLSGQQVGGLAMFDARNPRTCDLAAANGGRPSVAARVLHHLKRMSRSPVRTWFSYLSQRWVTIRTFAKRKAWRFAYNSGLLNDRRAGCHVRQMEQVMILALAKYAPGPYDGPVILIRAEDRARGPHEDPTCGWGSLVADLRIHEVPGTHRTMFQRPHVAIPGSILCEMMDGEMPAAAERLTPSAQPAKALHDGR